MVDCGGGLGMICGDGNGSCYGYGYSLSVLNVGSGGGDGVSGTNCGGGVSRVNCGCCCDWGYESEVIAFQDYFHIYR